jgi:hypothetical protein
VDDGGADPGPGQLRKSDFLAQLRSAVAAAIDAAVSDPDGKAAANAQVDQWFATKGGLDSASLEASIRQDIPNASGASAAADYISFAVADVQQTAASQAGDSSDGSANPSGDGAEPGVMAKALAGGLRETSSPRAIQARLGAGRPLEAGLQTRMASAMDGDFSQVRVHTDADAATLAGDLNARAFTVGQHVAFGQAEYQPGTPVGDALLAHELAHVAQQRVQGAPGPLATSPAGDETRLEADADRSAISAVLSMWTGAKVAAAQLTANAIPRLRSGLRLSRCAKGPSKQEIALTVFWSIIGTAAMPPGEPVPDPQTAQGLLDIIQGQCMADFNFWYASASGQHLDDRFKTVNWRAYQDQSVSAGGSSEWGGVWPLFKPDVIANTIKRGNGISRDLQ